MSCTGAELIIQLLEEQGVSIVAGIPGGALLPLYEALGRSPSIRHILARHEQAAGFIAHGSARMNGRAGVCLVTSGPGVTNVITALADAQLDSVPIVCIAGQVPAHLIGTNAFQEAPTLNRVRPITKASFFVRSAAELESVIPEAFRIAETGRPGPVLVDVPKDIQVQRVNRGTSSLSATPVRTRRSKSAELATKYDDAARLIAEADRPVLYVGAGVVRARAHEHVRRLSEHAEIPVTATLMALGTLPAHHPLNLGMLGMHGARYTNLALDECDLLIALGVRFDDRATGRLEQFVPHARIVHIDIDAREFGKIKQPTLAIHDDAGHAARELLKRVPAAIRDNWLARIAVLKASHPLQTPRDDELCSPRAIVWAVGQLAPENAVITTDVGQHQMWVAQAYPFMRPDRWLTSGGLGTMGFGLPAAIGAALADPSAVVICFTGDGSLLMNIQELATLAELDLNVKIVLLDNAALRLVRQQQELPHGQRLVGSLFSQPSNLVNIAEAFGVPAVDLEAAAAPLDELTAALSTEGPMLIRVPIAASHHVLPMVAPGAANREAIDYPQAVPAALVRAP